MDSHDKFVLIWIALYGTGAILWFVSFVKIIRSDNTNLAKVCLLASICIIPILGTVYPFLPNFLKAVKKE